MWTYLGSLFPLFHAHNSEPNISICERRLVVADIDTASTAQLTAQQQLRSPNKISDAGYKLYLHLVLLGGGKVTPRCTLHSCLHLPVSTLHITDLLLSRVPSPRSASSRFYQNRKNWTVPRHVFPLSYRNVNNFGQCSAPSNWREIECAQCAELVLFCHLELEVDTM